MAKPAGLAYHQAVKWKWNDTQVIHTCSVTSLPKSKIARYTTIEYFSWKGPEMII